MFFFGVIKNLSYVKNIQILVQMAKSTLKAFKAKSEKYLRGKGKKTNMVKISSILHVVAYRRVMANRRFMLI